MQLMSNRNAQSSDREKTSRFSILNHKSELLAALCENAEALRRASELITNSGRPPAKLSPPGAPAKILFRPGLHYITGQERYHRALEYFRKFLLNQVKWNEEKIGDFLAS